jgi:cytochrome c oxidase subunit IV
MLRSSDQSQTSKTTGSLLEPLLALLSYLLLLALNVGLALINLGPFGFPVAMTLAALQAVLIAVFFMELRRASHLTLIFASAGVIWLFIMFALTMSDYLLRRIG